MKYFYFVSTLLQETALLLLPFLQNQPALVKYKGLKALLLSTFGFSRRDRAARLLHMDGLRNRPR